MNRKFISKLMFIIGLGMVVYWSNSILSEEPLYVRIIGVGLLSLGCISYYLGSYPKKEKEEELSK